MIYQNKDSPIAILVLCIAIISFQSGSAFATGVFKEIGPIATVALRQGFSAILLLIFAKIWTFDFKNFDIKTLTAYGLSLGAMNLFFYLSIERIPLGIAVAIEFSGPLLVSVFSSRRKTDFIWILFAAIGIYMLLPVHEFAQKIDTLGLLFAIIAAFAWGAYIVFGHKIGKTMNELNAVSLGMAISALISIPLALFFTKSNNISLFNWFYFGIVLCLLSGAVPYAMEMFAMRRMKRLSISLLMSLDPAFAVLSGFFFLGQKLNSLQIFAIILIIIASLGSSLINPKSKKIDEIIL